MAMVRLMGWLCLVMLPFGPAMAQESTVARPLANLPDDEFLEPYRAAAVDRWQNDIQRLESLNETETHTEDAILFLGSSSIRRWVTIASDITPYEPIQRGFGGSMYSDVAVFAERLIQPHRYRALVIFVANDVKGSAGDHSPDQVERFIHHIMAVSRAHQPDSPVLLVEVTPTAKRWQAWPKIREVNARIREIALTTPHTYFIATAEHYLTPDAQPRSDLFVSDQLHLNEAGYQIWGNLIRSRLDEVLAMESDERANPVDSGAP
jgi:hypothetical protein